MNLELTSEQEAVVAQIAQQDGKSPADVLVETAVWLCDMAESEAERRVLDERVAEADAGVEWISEAEMDLRVQKMLTR